MSLADFDLNSLLVPGLLAVIAGQIGYGARWLKKQVTDQGQRLTRLEFIHLKHHPKEYADFKIGGSD